MEHRIQAEKSCYWTSMNLPSNIYYDNLSHLYVEIFMLCSNVFRQQVKIYVLSRQVIVYNTKFNSTMGVE